MISAELIVFASLGVILAAIQFSINHQNLKCEQYYEHCFFLQETRIVYCYFELFFVEFDIDFEKLYFTEYHVVLAESLFIIAGLTLLKFAELGVYGNRNKRELIIVTVSSFLAPILSIIYWLLFTMRICGCFGL